MILEVGKSLEQPLRADRLESDASAYSRWILYHLSYQGSPTNPNQHWQQIQSVDFYFVGSSWGDQACLLSPGYGGDLLIGTNSPERRQKNRLGG